MKVVHCKKEKYDVYIGRPSKWGNPFKVGIDGGQQQVVDMYKEWITKGDGIYLLRDLHEIVGKTLGCWCKPKACHGDVLAKLAEVRGRML